MDSKLLLYSLGLAIEAKASAFALYKLLVDDKLQPEFRKEYLHQVELIIAETEQLLELKFPEVVREALKKNASQPGQ